MPKTKISQYPPKAECAMQVLPALRKQKLAARMGYIAAEMASLAQEDRCIFAASGHHDTLLYPDKAVRSSRTGVTNA
jgi:hypothetical protein